MGAADHTEKVLREMHILFSKAPVYEGTNVVLDKNVVIDCLRELRQCMYEMMNEYELTIQSREKANRELKRENDERIMDSVKQAQDIYAASIMYTDHSMHELQDVVSGMRENINQMSMDFDTRIKGEMQKIKSNQLELKSRLEGLLDEEMYLRLITEANERREKEKEKNVQEEEIPSPYTHIKADIRVNEDLIDAIGGVDVPPMEEKDYSKIVPDIKVNMDYYEKQGITIPEGLESDVNDKIAGEIDIDSIGEDVIAETLSSESIADEHSEGGFAEDRMTQDISDEELAQISANLDAEYFGWKKEAEEELEEKNKNEPFFKLGKKKNR